ncbi:hypothetical protein [Alteripontixanthobacter muriae]|uniref:hypothetical protein n=1 Tax=Alteripontixanthobacter muriae TaxID=2705546 RepID=UPI0019D61E19|nr:hypothetical protein [Alteripontixanthobacter muriae]
MKNGILPVLVAGTMLLGGCAAGVGGSPLGGIFGSVLGGNVRNDNDRFERAAADACGREAARYGRVAISDVRQTSRDIVRVDGRVLTRDRYERRFSCIFRSDGRIVDFRVD